MQRKTWSILTAQIALAARAGAAIIQRPNSVRSFSGAVGRRFLYRAGAALLLHQGMRRGATTERAAAKPGIDGRT